MLSVCDLKTFGAFLFAHGAGSLQANDVSFWRVETPYVKVFWKQSRNYIGNIMRIDSSTIFRITNIVYKENLKIWKNRWNSIRLLRKYYFRIHPFRIFLSQAAVCRNSLVSKSCWEVLLGNISKHLTGQFRTFAKFLNHQECSLGPRYKPKKNLLPNNLNTRLYFLNQYTAVPF